MKKLATAIGLAGALLLCAACSKPKSPEPTPPAEAAQTEATPANAAAANETPAPAAAPGARGGMCGGVGGVKCADEADYCALESGACSTIDDASGVCKQRPEVCTQDYDPVCGCDGETYPNACSAASKGVSVAYGGECKAASE